jgi:ABC-type transporter Mla subunit MlaD
MKYTANIHAGDVTITVKQVTRVIMAIDSGHPIPANSSLHLVYSL